MEQISGYIKKNKYNKKQNIIDEVKTFVLKEAGVKPKNISFRNSNIIIKAENSYEAIAIKNVIYRLNMDDYKIRVSV